MLFCSAPRQIEIVQSRNAPVGAERADRAAERGDEEPRVRERDHEAVPPRHGLEELSLLNLGSSHCFSSSSAPRPASGHTVNKLAHPGPARLYHVPRTSVNRSCAFSPAGPDGSRAERMIGGREDGMAEVRDRDRTRRAAGERADAARGRSSSPRCRSRIDPAAEEMAIASALEAGVPLDRREHAAPAALSGDRDARRRRRTRRSRTRRRSTRSARPRRAPRRSASGPSCCA